MSLSCPRCKTVQPQENRHCTECGIPFPLSPDEKKDAPVFRFAEPVLLAEAGPTADTPVSETPLPPAQTKPPSLPPVLPSMRRPLPETLSPTVLLTEANLPPINPRKKEEPEAEIAESVPERVKPPPAWKMPAFSAVAGAVILAFAGAGWIVSHASTQAKQGVDRVAYSSATAVAQTKKKPPRPALPLTLLLSSAAAGRHVSVGSPVVITAFAMLNPGQSAALSLSCRPEGGRKTMFSFAEGRLCSANWIPSTPGRYQFTATALDAQSHKAVARPLWIVVDQPVLSARAPSLLPLFKVSRSLAEWHAPRLAVRAVRHHRTPRVLAVRTAPPPRSSPALLRSASSPAASAHPGLYHVVAASFRFPGNADILAHALRSRGLNAVAGHRRTKNGKIAYVVEVGAYRQPGEAQQKTLVLQRSGYPAYTQRIH